MNPSSLIRILLILLAFLFLGRSLPAGDTLAEAYVEGGRKALLEGDHRAADHLSTLALRQAVDSEADDVLPTVLLLAGEAKLELGQIDMAADMFRLCLRFADVVEPSDPAIRASALSGLTHVRYEQGQLVEAEALGQKAEDLLTAAGLETEPAMAAALNNLSLVKSALGKPADAQALAVKALRILEDATEDEHPHEFQVMDTLAQIHHAAGDHETATALAQKAHELAKRRHGEESLAAASSLSTLAKAHDLGGRADDAEAVLKTAVDIFTRKSAAEHRGHQRARSHLESLKNRPTAQAAETQAESPEPAAR